MTTHVQVMHTIIVCQMLTCIICFWHGCWRIPGYVLFFWFPSPTCSDRPIGLLVVLGQWATGDVIRLNSSPRL